MAEEITDNLVYLTTNLTNLPIVLAHCVQNQIITRYEKEQINAGETSFDKNDRFFDILLKKDWARININFISILRKTSNEHCANKIEDVETPLCEKQQDLELYQGQSVADSSLQMPNSEKRAGILKSKWWPEEKHLPKAFLERKGGNIKLIDILKENLINSKNMSTVINQGTTVSGMGGVGKTTTAKWFAIHFQDSYDYIIWIDSGEGNLLTSFIDLAKELKIDTTLQPKSLTRACFSRLEETDCLFIFDNAECYQGDQGIREFLPRYENFHTIITSRTKEWGSESGDGKIPEMHLNAFATSDSVEFLMKNLKDKSYKEDQLKELGDLLGNLPLALQISVTTINTKKLSINEYIRRIKKTDQIINQRFDDYEKTINKTMKISLDIIKNHEEDPRQTALKILLIFGYIKPDFVEFQLFQAVENFSEFETESAMELLEKYSLITINSYLGENRESCSIHRLLQQVIRYNGKENERIILKKILSVEGFLDYKLLPYLYADQETQSLFPKLRAQLIDQRNLEKFLEKRRFSEAVDISRMIKDALKTPMAEYNYVVCLTKITELTGTESVLKALQNYLQNEMNNYEEYPWFEDQFQKARDQIRDNINENGLWSLEVQIEPSLVRGLLFLIYKKLRMDDSVLEIINQDCQLINLTIPQSLDYVIEHLKSPLIGNYRLENEKKFIFFKLRDNYEKKIALKECSLSEDFPNDLEHLSLENVEIQDKDGHPLQYYDLSPSISNNLISLTIISRGSTKFAIPLNGNLHSCRSIKLSNCIILLQKGRRINPVEIDFKNVSFKENEEEIEFAFLNDLIDFENTKKLTLTGSNMSMKLDKSVSMDEISLHFFNSLDLNGLNCTVQDLNISNTDVPLLEKNIALHVKNKLRLSQCSVYLTSLFYLSQNANYIKLSLVSIKIGYLGIEKTQRICATNVKMFELKLTQDANEVTAILLHQIFDLTRIKKLIVWTWKKEDIAMTFDLNQQFSLDHLELKNVELINWNESTSSVKTLRLTNVEIHNVLINHSGDQSSYNGRKLFSKIKAQLFPHKGQKLKLIRQFKITESLFIYDSVVDINSLVNISAETKGIGIWNTSLHWDANFEHNNSPSKSHCIGSQVKEIELGDITLFKYWEKVQSFPVNEFINISQLNILDLRSNEKKYCRFTLNLENISLSLDKCFLKEVTVLNWDNGKGQVNKMKLIGIPLTKRINIKINSLEFGASSIDLSCLPKSIQRIQLEKDSIVSCGGQLSMNDLSSLVLHRNHSLLTYFSRCPNLSKIELRYCKDEEFLLNLQWMPLRITTIKLNWEYFYPGPPPLTIIGTGNRRFKLKTLIIDDFSLSQIDLALDVLQPENVVIQRGERTYGQRPPRETKLLTKILTNKMVDIAIKLTEFYISVAIGRFSWINDEHFQSSPISKVVGERGEFYIFNNQTGRVIPKTEFDQMLEI